MAASDILSVYPLSSGDGKDIPLGVVKPLNTRLISVTNVVMAGSGVDAFSAGSGLAMFSNLGENYMALSFGATPIDTLAMDTDYANVIILAPQTDYVIYSDDQYISAILISGTADTLVMTRLTKWDALTLSQFLETP